MTLAPNNIVERVRRGSRVIVVIGVAGVELGGTCFAEMVAEIASEGEGHSEIRKIFHAASTDPPDLGGSRTLDTGTYTQTEIRIHMG